jgi:hypothetical protein
MIRASISLTLAALVLAAPTSVAAQAIEEKNLISGKAKYDPKLGYIFARGPFRQNAMLLRLAEAGDVAAYEKAWAEALAKAKEKYARQMKNYERDVAMAKQTKSKPPEKPIEPTEANFAIGAIEMQQPVTFGPQFVFAKPAKDGGSQDYSYLQGVRPGRYVYYGPIFLGPNGSYVGACYCMGTVSFEVKAGQVTDLGNFLLVGPGADPAFTSTEELQGSEAGLYRPQQLAKQYGPLSYGLPASLKDWPSSVADWRAHGHIGNHLGITVMRMPPVEGVLAYDRDKVIDVKAKAAAEAAR